MCRHILSLVILSPKIRHSGACNSAWLWRLPIERLFRLVCLTSDSRLSLRNSSSLSNFSFWFATTRGMMKDKSLKLRLSPVYCFPAGQGLLWFRHLPSFSLYRHPSKIRVRRSRVIRRSLCLPALKGARLLLVGAAQAHCTKKPPFMKTCLIWRGSLRMHGEIYARAERWLPKKEEGTREKRSRFVIVSCIVTSHAGDGYRGWDAVGCKRGRDGWRRGEGGGEEGDVGRGWRCAEQNTLGTITLSLLGGDSQE